MSQSKLETFQNNQIQIWHDIQLHMYVYEKF